MSSLLVIVAVAASPTGMSLENCFGSVGLTRVSGNGGLTVGVNARGRIVSCCWPAPGACDQLIYLVEPEDSGDAPPWHGLQWGVSFGDDFLWLSDPILAMEQRYLTPGIPIIVTEGRIAPDGALARQVLFVHPEQDVFVARLEVEGPEQPPVFCFFANFTPCTRLIPELPLGDWALDGLNDFAAYADADTSTVTHFRPAAPSMRDWERARGLAARGTAGSEWETFREGTCITYGAASSVQAIMLGDEAAFERADALQFTGDDKGRAGATGQCYSAMLVTPEHEGAQWSATVLAAFGAKAAISRQALADAQARGYQRLLEETEQFWNARLARVAAPQGAAPEQQAALRDALAALLVSADRAGGAIVRAPVTQPPLALDWSRHGAWINLALDVAGYVETVERHLRFYAKTVRRTHAQDRPIGSLPAACYATGQEALPRMAMDADASAWFVASVWRHSMFLDSQAKVPMLASFWDDISLCTDFLVRWSHSLLGGPPPSFDFSALRDRSTLESLVAFYLGIESAMRIAGALEKAVPAPWEQQRRELQSLIQLRLARFETPQKWPAGVNIWLDAVLPEDHWLRKPMRIGDAAWVPLGPNTVTVPESGASSGPDTLGAALTVLRLLGTAPIPDPS